MSPSCSNNGLIAKQPKLYLLALPQCGHFINFISLKFYVKSYLGIVEVKKSHFNTFRGSGFFLWIFALFQNWNLPNWQNSEVLKLLKWQFLSFKILQNGYHVKCEEQKNSEISTLCLQCFSSNLTLSNSLIIKLFAIIFMNFNKDDFFCQNKSRSSLGSLPSSLSSLNPGPVTITSSSTKISMSLIYFLLRQNIFLQ